MKLSDIEIQIDIDTTLVEQAFDKMLNGFIIYETIELMKAQIKVQRSTFITRWYWKMKVKKCEEQVKKLQKQKR